MQSIVWYAGIAVNGILTVLGAILLSMSFMKGSSPRKPARVASLSALLGIALSNLSLLLLYLQMGSMQYDLGPSETVWPRLFLCGYHLVLISMTCLVWVESYGMHWLGIPIIISQSLISLVTIGFMTDYIVYWDNGGVLVSLSVLSDYITLWLGMIVGVALVYHAFIKRFEVLSSSSFDTESLTDSSNYLLIALVFFAQFFIPRAVVGSILDPFSVKFVGALVTAGFAVVLFRYSVPRSDYKETISTLTESVKSEELGPSALQLGAGMTVIVLFLLASIFQPDFGQVDTQLLMTQSLFIGYWLGTGIYLNYVSVITPLLTWICMMMVYKRITDTKRIPVYRLSRLWLLLTAIIGGLLFLGASYSYTIGGWQGTGAIGHIILPFLVSPIIVAVILETLGKKGQGWSIDTSDNFMSLVSRVLLLYGVTLLTIIIVDFIVSFPPFLPESNYVFLGAAGVFDGVFWAPIVTPALFEIVRSLRELV